MTKTTPSRRQQRYRAHSPADLLALVPTFFGFHPEDSLVLITLGDAGQPFHARVDLPTDPVQIDDLADHLAAVAGRHCAERLVAVAYSDDAALSVEVFAALSAHLDHQGVELVAAVRADGERWWAHDDRGERGRGTRYDVSSHPTVAQAVLDGTVLHRSRQDLADSLVGRDPDEIDAVAVLACEAVERFARGVDHPLGPAAARRHLVVEGRWVRERVRRFLADAAPLDRDDTARLVVLVIASHEVRDVVLAEMHQDNASDHVELWLDVTRRVPADLRAAPAALLGLAAWLSGNGALAWCAVERARDADPDHDLAGFLAGTLDGAVPPGSWSPPSDEDLTLFRG